MNEERHPLEDWMWVNDPKSADWTKQTDDDEVFYRLFEEPVTRDAQGGVVRVPKREPSAIIRGTEIVKGERSANGYRSYWLVENGEIKKSVSALTDEEAKKALQD